MWVSRRRFRALEDEVSDLRQELQDKIMELKNEVQWSNQMSITLPTPTLLSYKNFPLREVVRMILDHLGLKINYSPEEYTLQPSKDKVD